MRRVILECLLIAVVGCGAIILLSQLSGPVAHADPVGGGDANVAAPPAWPAAISDLEHVKGLRAVTCTGDEDLAAMGCSAESTGSVIGGLRSWYTAHKTEYLAALRNSRSSDQATRSAGLRALVDLRKAAVAAVDAMLAAPQKAIWQTIKSNRGMPGEFRYAPELSAAARKTLLAALQKRDRLLASAKLTADQLRIEQEYDQAIQGILTAPQQTAVGAAKANLRQRMAEVLVASRQALAQ